jgi:hypothetical protein
LIVPLQPIGDPKSLSLLDKCEWDGDELSDDFDLVPPASSPQLGEPPARSTPHEKLKFAEVKWLRSFTKGSSTVDQKSRRLTKDTGIDFQIVPEVPPRLEIPIESPRNTFIAEMKPQRGSPSRDGSQTLPPVATPQTIPKKPPTVLVQICFPSFETHSVVSAPSDNDASKVVGVVFRQPRDFILFPPPTDLGEDFPEVDDAVSTLFDNFDECMTVPLTPPTTPVGWKPPKQQPYSPAPFTQMLVERLEAGLDEPQSPESGSSSDSDDDDAKGDAVEQAIEEAERRRVLLELERDRTIEEKINEVRSKFVSPTSSDVVGLYYAPSKKNIRSRGAPVVLRSIPTVMTSAVAALKKLKKQTKEDARAIAERERSMDLEAFRPSRFRLAQMLRLVNFGSLMLALLSNPSGPLPKPVTVSMADLGRSLHAALKGQRISDQTVLWQSLVADLLKLKRVPSSCTLPPFSASIARAPDLKSSQDCRKGVDRSRMVSEKVLLMDAPGLGHFLPRPSTKGRSFPTTLANLRRVPRDAEMRGGLAPVYSGGTDSFFPRGSAEASKNFFVSTRVRTPSTGSRESKRSERTLQVFEAQKALLRSLEGERFDVMRSEV